jgi:hypothetical protein
MSIVSMSIVSMSIHYKEAFQITLKPIALP